MPDHSTQTTVRIAALDGLAALMERAGVDLKVTLRRLGIDPVVLDEPENRIALSQLVQVLDLAAESTGDDCLGLHLGAAQSLHIAGVLGYALKSSPDVQAQLALAARYFALHQDGAEVSLQVRGAEAVLRYTILDPQVTLHRHDAEATLALCVNQWRLHTGMPDWAPGSVHFEHPAPQPASERELLRFFRCAVHFGDTFDGMRFPANFLQTSLRTADSALHQILTRYADDCLAQHADASTLVGRVRRLIASGLANGNSGIDDVAGRLAMTPRTLQRRLADASLQFADLLDETRRELATQYLRDTRITLTDATRT